MKKLLVVVMAACIVFTVHAKLCAEETAAAPVKADDSRPDALSDNPKMFPDAVVLYHDNYFLAGSVNDSVIDGSGIDTRYCKFQISVAYRVFLWSGRKDESGLYFAYTQKSIWDLFNFEKSSPFIESNYSPEFFYRGDLAGKTILGITFTRLNYVQFGLWKHESNGLGGERTADSRSWDRGYFEFEYALVKDHLLLIPRVWATYVISGENSDITGYLGYGQLTLKTMFDMPFLMNTHVSLAATGRKGEYPDMKKGSIELMLVLSDLEYHYRRHDTRVPMGLFVQFFTGYGETLLEYNRFNRVIRAGFGFPN